MKSGGQGGSKCGPDGQMRCPNGVQSDGAVFAAQLLAAANELGRVVDIRQCLGEGPGWYASKYIAKGLDTIPEGRASRLFFPKETPAEPEPPHGALVKR